MLVQSFRFLNMPADRTRYHGATILPSPRETRVPQPVPTPLRQLPSHTLMRSREHTRFNLSGAKEFLVALHKPRLPR